MSYMEWIYAWQPCSCNSRKCVSKSKNKSKLCAQNNSRIFCCDPYFGSKNYMSQTYLIHGFRLWYFEREEEKQWRNKTFSLPWISLPPPFISLSILPVSAKGLARRVDVAIHQNVIMHKSAYPIPFYNTVCVCVCVWWVVFQAPVSLYSKSHEKCGIQTKRRTDQ